MEQGISEAVLILYCTNADQTALRGDVFCGCRKIAVLVDCSFHFNARRRRAGPSDFKQKATLVEKSSGTIQKMS